MVQPLHLDETETKSLALRDMPAITTSALEHVCGVCEISSATHGGLTANEFAHVVKACHDGAEIGWLHTLVEDTSISVVNMLVSPV